MRHRDNHTHGPGKPEIPDKHGSRGAHHSAECRLAAAKGAAVGDVVVEEGGVVEHFGCGSKANAFEIHFSARAAHEQRNHRTQLLPGIEEELLVGIFEQRDVGAQMLPHLVGKSRPVLSKKRYDIFPSHSSSSSSATESTICRRALSAAVSIFVCTKWSKRASSGS